MRGQTPDTAAGGDGFSPPPYDRCGDKRDSLTTRYIFLFKAFDYISIAMWYSEILKTTKALAENMCINLLGSQKHPYHNTVPAEWGAWEGHFHFLPVVGCEGRGIFAILIPTVEVRLIY
jgi:hypothetical protein